MKLHSRTLTYADLHTALKAAPGVHLDRAEPRGSRSHGKGWDIALESDGTPDVGGKPRRFARNVGKAGRFPGEHPGFAASYDDWGRYLAVLFDLDPDLHAGPYKGRDHFHEVTQHAYVTSPA